jgi:hypothetical protein
LSDMARKLNAARKQAVIRAILEGGMDGRQASAAAAAGELGLEPFEIAPTTARDLASRARRVRERNGSNFGPHPDEQKQREWLQAQVDRIMALEAPTAKDIHALKHAQAAIDDIVRRADRRAALQPAPAPEETTGGSSPLLERMLAFLRVWERAERDGVKRPCAFSLPWDPGPMPERETRPCVGCGKQRDEHELIHPRCYGDGEW